MSLDDTATMPDPVSFLASGWQERVNDLTSYVYIWDRLSEIAREQEVVNQDRSNALVALAKAASLRLSETDPDQPFVPIAILQDKRSASIADFSKSELKFMSMIAKDIENLQLRARVADLLWILLDSERFTFAALAIQAYVQFPVSLESWFAEGRDAHLRAFAIASQLGKAGSAQALEHATRLHKLALSLDHADGFLCLQVADVLPRNRMGTELKMAMAAKLQSVGETLVELADFPKARSYLRAALQWLITNQDPVARSQLLVRIAESYVAQSQNASTGSRQADALLAQINSEKAIQTYREVPRNQRAQFGVDSALDRLQRGLSDLGRAGLDNLAPTSSEPIDISVSVESARVAVMNKPADEALRQFANIFVFFDSERALKEAQERVNAYPLQHLFSSVHISSDGRVVSKGRGRSETHSLDRPEHIRFQVFRMYPIHIGLVAWGRILPAVEALRSEHRFRHGDFLGIVVESAIVPPDCAHLYARGLSLGFEGDYLGAIHILAPQVENVVRAHLKAANVLTTHLDRDGVESELGLASLLERPEVRLIFGPDISLEIECLFTSQVGPNFRNRVAHGLIRDKEQGTAEILYAWWFCLRLVYVPFWNRLRGLGESQSHQGNDRSGGQDA